MIQIRWEIHLALIQVVAMWLLWSAVHGATAAVLSWHMQYFIAIWDLQLSYTTIDFPSNLNCDAKSSWNGLQNHMTVAISVYVLIYQGHGGWAISVMVDKAAAYRQFVKKNTCSGWQQQQRFLVITAINWKGQNLKGQTRNWQQT